MLKNRQSFVSSMGISALDRLMMYRRRGTLAPGVILYLMQ
jgi:acetate kinase